MSARRFPHSPVWFSRLLFLIAFSVGSVLAPFSVAAHDKPGHARQPKAAKGKAKSAAALFAEGSAARAAGDLVAARSALTAAYLKQPTPFGLRELGLLARAEQRPLESYDLLRRYLIETESVPSASAARAEVAKLVEGSPLAHGRLRITGEPGAMVYIDARPVGVLPLSAPLLLSTEEHKLRIERRGKRDSYAEAQIQVPTFRMAEVQLGHGGSHTLLVELLPAILLVLDVSTQDARTELELKALSERLGSSLEKTHLTVLPAPVALDFTGARRLGSCLSELDCQSALSKLCALDYALHIRMERANSASPGALSMKLLDVAVSEVSGTSAPTCDGCDAFRLAAKLAESARTMVEQSRARPRGQLEIVSEPSDAEVVLNGRVLGHTPYRSSAWVGTYVLRLRHSGSEPEERRLVVTEGQSTSVRITLSPEVPEPPPAPIDESRDRPPPILPPSDVPARSRSAARVGAGAMPSGAVGSGAAFSAAPSRPVYRSWWLWTVVGVAAAGAATAIGLGVASQGPDVSGVPSMTLRFGK